MQTEHLTVVFFRVSEEGEAARRDHPATPGARPAVTLRLVLVRPAQRRIDPSERLALELGVADVHRPVDQHLESESTPCVDLGHTHPSRLSVRKLHKPDARDLCHAANHTAQLIRRVLFVVDVRHFTSHFSYFAVTAL